MMIGAKALNSGGSSASPDTSPPVLVTASPAGTQLPQALTLPASAVRLVDPQGNRTEGRNVALVVDGKQSTQWTTERYNQNFGPAYKPGMGLLLDLGSTRRLSDVQVELNAVGASVRLFGGMEDPGPNGDATLLSSYTALGDPLVDYQATSMHFPISSTAKFRYVLVWITGMPQDGDRYRVGIQEIIVRVP
jgi:hypothetical protein